MIRRTLWLASITSSMFAVMFAVAGIHTAFANENIGWERMHKDRIPPVHMQTGIQLAQASLAVCRVRTERPHFFAPPPPSRVFVSTSEPTSMWFYEQGQPVLGFRWDRTQRRTVNAVNQLSGWQLVVPLWALVGASAILAIILTLIQKRAGDPAPGQCWTCGYDLRATPDRCPECGQEVVTSGTPSRPV